MAINFTIDYATISNAASVLDASNEEYTELSNVLQTLRTNLTSTYFVGLTGNAASAFLERLQAEIATACTHCQATSAALTATLRDTRDNIDPGMAARFQ